MKRGGTRRRRQEEPEVSQDSGDEEEERETEPEVTQPTTSAGQSREPEIGMSKAELMAILDKFMEINQAQMTSSNERHEARMNSLIEQKITCLSENMLKRGDLDRLAERNKAQIAVLNENMIKRDERHEAQINSLVESNQAQMTNLIEHINSSFREVETRMEAGLSDLKAETHTLSERLNTTSHELKKQIEVNKDQINSLREGVVKLTGETEKEIGTRVQAALNSYRSEVDDKLQNMENIIQTQTNPVSQPVAAPPKAGFKFAGHPNEHPCVFLN